MSLVNSFRIAFVALALISLQGCSSWSVSQLQPELQAELSQINLPKPESRLEQLVLQELQKNILQPSDVKSYTLEFTVSAGGNSAVSGSTLRTSTTKLTFTLTDISSGDVVLSDSLSASGSSGAVSGLYANEKSTQFSGERLAKLLANRMVQRIALFIAGENGDSAQ